MSNSKIYVGNLPYSANEAELEEVFGQYGPVAEVKVIIDRATGRSKGFGFVTFEEDAAAKSALEANGQDMGGRALRVSPANEDRRQKSF